jgi:hypothetical protein
VRIDRPGGEDSFLATVDTGFNGDLFMSAVDARLTGFVGIGLKARVKFADSTRLVEETAATILWMGRAREVELLLSQSP